MSHNSPVTDNPMADSSQVDYKESIGELADLMQEFRLTEARLQTGDLTIAFRRRPTPRPSSAAETQETSDAGFYEAAPAVPSGPAAPKGLPVTSPMPGIFYNSPSPGSAPFVNEGDTVSAGQIVGLIEAMKVFNEIPSTIAGTVLQVVAVAGQIVNPGDVLLYVG
jgi:acetyl-CoA carboxylase biotin carboxyl carrier protein